MGHDNKKRYKYVWKFSNLERLLKNNFSPPIPTDKENGISFFFYILQHGKHILFLFFREDKQVVSIENS